MKSKLEAITKEQERLGKLCIFKVYSKCEKCPEGKYRRECYRGGFKNCLNYLNRMMKIKYNWDGVLE